MNKYVTLADDIIQLVRLDQGAELEVKEEMIDLAELGKEVYQGSSTLFSLDKVKFAVELEGGSGPSTVKTDGAVLKRILRVLLTHAADVTVEGEVQLKISYQDKRCTFTVTDSGPEYEGLDTDVPGKLPPIFQRYHQDFIPESPPSLSEADTLRSKIEKGVNVCTRRISK